MENSISKKRRVIVSAFIGFLVGIGLYFLIKILVN